MPELPEVEVVRAGLASSVAGRTIGAVHVLHPRPVRYHLSGPDAFASDLVGRRVGVARRRGKYLWLPLDDTDALLVHLGMSGQFRSDPPDAELQRHARVLLDLDDGRQVRFVDQRMFGGLHVSHGGAELPGELAHIARDLFDPALDRAAVVERFRTRRSAVKRVLLDQGVVSGIGNIYADEALWRAGLHGGRPANELSAVEIGAVLDAARAVMDAGLAEGGTSFDALYVNVNGESGYFDRSLQAYGQEGRPCERCGTPIRREHFMNRSSFFCPRCQRVPRARS